MRYDNIAITHDDVKANKYRHVSGGAGGKLEAKILFKDNGEIDADFSYTDSYCQKHKLGKYANQSGSSSKTNSGGGSFGGGALFGGSKREEVKEVTPPKPLSPAERELLERDIESNKQSTPSKYILRVIEHYMMVSKLKPNLDEEIELKEEKIKEFIEFMMEFPVPKDSLEFFYTLGYLEFGETRTMGLFGGDKLFNKTKSKFSLKEMDVVTERSVLLVRMKEIAYQNEKNSPLNTKEVMNTVKEIDDERFENTTAYNTALENLYKDIVKRGDANAFNELVELLVNDFVCSEEEVKKFRLPTSDREETIAICNILAKYKNNTHSALNVKFKELKEAILAQYGNDEMLMKFVAMQDERELRRKARIYNKVKYISLIACIVLSALLYGLPLILWIVLFFTKLHDKIAFLKKGRDALKSVYELDGKKPGFFKELSAAFSEGKNEVPANATSKRRKVRLIDIVTDDDVDDDDDDDED